jgi:hypothetical protein
MKKIDLSQTIQILANIGVVTGMAIWPIISTSAVCCRRSGWNLPSDHSTIVCAWHSFGSFGRGTATISPKAIATTSM